MLGTRKFNKVAIDLFQGDITTFYCDVMVNAANEDLTGGPGVDGAIHLVGGPSIRVECVSVGKCPTGEAVVTGAGNLPAAKVIHAVGPVWQGGDEGEELQLQSAYQSALRQMVTLGLRHICVPAISAGANGYPVQDAACVAMVAVKVFLAGESLGKLGRITFVLFSKEDYQTFQNVLFSTFPEIDSE